MFEDSINQPFDVVPNRWGHVRATIASNAAVLTAVDQTVKFVHLQAGVANASVVRVMCNGAASAVIGLEIPKATGTVAGTGELQLSVSSLTCLQFYGGNNNDVVDVLYRG